MDIPQDADFLRVLTYNIPPHSNGNGKSPICHAAKVLKKEYTLMKNVITLLNFDATHHQLCRGSGGTHRRGILWLSEENMGRWRF